MIGLQEMPSQYDTQLAAAAGEDNLHRLIVCLWAHGLDCPEVGFHFT